MLSSMEQSKPIEIFFCYAREDEALRNELEKHLRILRRQGQVITWHDREIQPGKEWEREIDRHLNKADIVLLLVSPDFMDSDYCYSKEMKRALKRHENGTARVIPIILRPVHWEDAPFSKLQILPTDAKPVTNWVNHDDAFYNIAKGIRIAVKELFFQRTQEQSSFVDENTVYRARQYTRTPRKPASNNTLEILYIPPRFYKKEGNLRFVGQLYDEEICMVIRKHWWFLVRPAVPFIASFALLGLVFFGAVRFPNPLLPWPFFEILAIVLFFGTLGWFIWEGIILWRYEVHIITNKRIISSRGLLDPTYKLASIENVKEIDIGHDTSSGYIMRYGLVYLYMAGGDMIMDNVPNPTRIKDVIEQIINELQRR